MKEKSKYPLLQSILEQYFEFDGFFNLPDYSVSLSELYKELKPLCKNRYKNNYRFIFLHYDTDYHITNDQPGLILRNLQRILTALDISNFFAIVVSQKDLQPHLNLLRQQETTDNCAIFCLQNFLQESKHFDKFDVNLNKHDIKHKFMCLNRVKKKHRTVLYALLKNANLLNQGAVSYGYRK